MIWQRRGPAGMTFQIAAVVTVVRRVKPGAGHYVSGTTFALVSPLEILPSALHADSV
jgi:hypothetical protein